MNISRVQCAGCDPKAQTTFAGRKKDHSTGSVAKKVIAGGVAIGAVAGGIYAVRSGKAKSVLNTIADSNTFKSVTKFVSDAAGSVKDFFTSLPGKISKSK